MHAKFAKREVFTSTRFPGTCPMASFMATSGEAGDSFKFCVGCSTNPMIKQSYQESNNLDKSFECIT